MRDEHRDRRAADDGATTATHAPVASAPSAERTRATLLLVDVEPDARKTARGCADGWAGTRTALPLIARLRRELAERTGRPVTLNWFLRMDPQIALTWGRADWIRHAVPEVLETIAAHGDYAGIHPHLWRWSARAAGWYSELEDEAWLRHCLDTAMRSYEDLFGRRAEACRFGDRCLTAAAIAELRARGLRYDLSLEPGFAPARPPGDRRARGRLPDSRRAPRVPYQPAGPDAAVDDLWLVPLTTSPARWRPTLRPPFFARTSVSPNLVLSPLLVAPLLARELGRVTHAPLVLVLRSGDLGHARFRHQFGWNVARLLADPRLARCEFTTPPVAIRRWRAARPTPPVPFASPRSFSPS